MSDNTLPLVSIGLPVFNAGKSIERVTAVLLSQDYPNFELVISDNASTDGTWEFCKQLEEQDCRVHVHRNSTNLGALVNFERVFALSKGIYFMWAAHDDDWDSTFVSQCVTALEQQPHAVLCYTDQAEIVSSNGTINRRTYDLDGVNPVAWKRMYSLLKHKPTPYATIYGVFRRDSIKDCFPLPRTAVFDIHFLLMVAHCGLLIRIPQTLFRKHWEPKDFHRRIQSIIPNYQHRHQSIVMLGFMGRLLSYVFSIREPLVGKLWVGLAVVRYVGLMVVVQAIPKSIRTTIRKLVFSRNSRVSAESSSNTHP